MSACWECGHGPHAPHECSHQFDRPEFCGCPEQTVWNAVAVEDIRAGQYVHMVKESDECFVVRLQAVQP